MRRVLATAGHVDHGKSSLVRALTDMDPDRWAEEKRRDRTPAFQQHAAVQPAPHTALDTYSRARFGPWPLPAATSRLGMGVTCSIRRLQI